MATLSGEPGALGPVKIIFDFDALAVSQVHTDRGDVTDQSFSVTMTELSEKFETVCCCWSVNQHAPRGMEPQLSHVKGTV